MGEIASSNDIHLETNTGSNMTSSGISNLACKDETDAGYAKRFRRSTTRERKFVEENIKKKMKVGEVITEAPTDCFGYIEFKETTKRSTGKFIRMSDDTEPAHLFELMTEHWGLETPRLLISVTGGAMSFDIPPRLKKDFQDGLLKVASTPGAWVISGGTNTGVMKMVGDVNHGTKNTCIGILTWGIVAKKESLMTPSGPDPNTFQYHLGSYLVEKNSAFLDYNHSHFLLVDDGSENKWGREIKFRGEFEEYIMSSSGDGNRKIPTVLLVLEGGPGTLDTVLNTAVKNRIPTVLVEGSGRAADLLVYALKSREQIQQCDAEKHEGLVNEMKKMNINESKFTWYYHLVLKCLDAKDIFTIADQETGMDTDDAILTALLNDPKSSPSHYEQLRLAILWDRVDLAETKVLSPMKSWEPEVEGTNGEKELHKLMIMALAMNKKDFVKLLLDYGVSIQSLLTRQVLEFLYSYRCAPMMRWEVTSQPMSEPIGEYEALFQRLLSYSAVPGAGRTANAITVVPLEKIEERLSQLLDTVPKSHLQNIMEIPKNQTDKFVSPFRQLFIWAVLNNMLDMALFLWEFEEAAIATALMATEITNRFMQDTRFKEMQDEEEKSLVNSFDTFSRLSIELMDACYKTNEKDTELLVTNRLELFNHSSSCLEYAVATKQEDFVAHPAVQGYLNAVWYGSIKSTSIRYRTVFAAIFCPLLLINMEIQTEKEMKTMTKADKDETTKHHECDDDESVFAQSEDYRTSSAREAKQIPPFHQKVYNFHVHSPLVRFFEHTLGYLMFLVLFSYVAMLEKKTTTPGGCEVLLIITVVGYLVAEIYQVIHVDASASVTVRLKSYFWDIWNLFDVLCILVFILALILRSIENTIGVGHLFYAFDVSLWIVRLINIMYAHPVSGPYVVMIGQMLSDMFNFLIILLIFLLSYGIAVRAILEPGPDDFFTLSLFHPYFNIHGEYFLNDPEEGKTRFGTPKRNNYAEPIALIYMAVYLLIANILLLNLLIAIFNNTYENVMANASRIWKFRRYSLIVEYAARRTFLCPPLSLISHFVIFIRWLYQRTATKQVQRSTGQTVIERSLRRLFSPGKMICKKKMQLHEFESSCSIKVIRKRQEEAAMEMIGEGGGSLMQRNEMEKKFNEQLLSNENMEKKLSKVFEEAQGRMSKELNELKVDYQKVKEGNERYEKMISEKDDEIQTLKEANEMFKREKRSNEVDTT